MVVRRESIELAMKFQQNLLRRIYWTERHHHSNPLGGTVGRMRALLSQVEAKFISSGPKRDFASG